MFTIKVDCNATTGTITVEYTTKYGKFNFPGVEECDTKFVESIYMEWWGAMRFTPEQITVSTRADFTNEKIDAIFKQVFADLKKHSDLY
jgi:hypothetical protein